MEAEIALSVMHVAGELAEPAAADARPDEEPDDGNDHAADEDVFSQLVHGLQPTMKVANAKSDGATGFKCVSRLREGTGLHQAASKRSAMQQRGLPSPDHRLAAGGLGIAGRTRPSDLHSICRPSRA